MNHLMTSETKIDQIVAPEVKMNHLVTSETKKDQIVAPETKIDRIEVVTFTKELELTSYGPFLLPAPL